MSIYRKLTGCFYRPAVWLVRCYCRGRPHKSYLRLKEALEAMEPGNPQAAETYLVRKTEAVLMLITILAGLCLLSLPLWFQKARPIDSRGLPRNPYGGQEHLETVMVQIDGDAEAAEETEGETSGQDLKQISETLSVTVPQQKYSAAQVQAILDEGCRELEEQLLGNNPSAEEVREDLCFPQQLQDGRIQVSYVTVPYGVIAADGRIGDTENAAGTLVTIDASLVCQGTTQTMQRTVKVFPPLYTEKEALLHRVMEKVAEADEDSAGEAWMQLPETVDAHTVRWYYMREPAFRILPVLLLVLPLLVFTGSDRRVFERMKQRQEELAEDYPHLLWKLTMLMGAGLTIRGAFQRLAGDYRKQQRSSQQRRYVCEEILYACRQMQNGCSEAQVYERFGRRCDLPEYIRLGTLLSQSLTKGSGELVQILEKEAAASMNLQKNLVRQKGEKAGMQMLFPMILMLGVVLVILMVPAFMTI